MITLHIKYEQTQRNVTNKIVQYPLCLSWYYCRTENYAEWLQFSTCETIAFILHMNTVIWTLSLSGTQNNFLCLCFVHSTIICSVICHNSPAVSKTIIQATRTVSFASLRINCDDIPTKAPHTLITTLLMKYFHCYTVHVVESFNHYTN